jgi:hypothetical protein
MVLATPFHPRNAVAIAKDLSVNDPIFQKINSEFQKLKNDRRSD